MGCEASCPVNFDHKLTKISPECCKSPRTAMVPRVVEQVKKPDPHETPVLQMSSVHKNILIKHYQTMLDQKPDIFHKTMLLCMQSSPKINEIIACQMYCYRDLTKWPKLNQLCQAQLNFYDRLINVHNLDGYAVQEAVFSLGVVHYRYAQYGLKPHFLDMWQLNMEKIAAKLKFADESERETFLAAINVLNSYVTSVMNLAYSRCQMKQMDKDVTSRIFEDEAEPKLNSF